MAGRRSEARRYAVLALYQWQVSGLPPVEIERQFFDDPAWIGAVADALAEDSEDAARASQRTAAATPDRREFDLALFAQLLRGVPEQADAIDEALTPVLDRSLQSLDPVERAILRVGTYELLFSPELPVRVVINEAIELAKTFGAEQGHRYVNGVLDKVARRVRASEVGTRGARPAGR
jgi:N utilization substance protein B